MKDATPIAVTSRSFSKHPVLRAELLERYQAVRFNDEGRALSGRELAEFLSGHPKAITALETIDESLLSLLPELRVISKFGVGIDMIDLAALERHGVYLAHSPGTNRRSVSELALSLALALLRLIVPSILEVRAGQWRQQKGRTLSGQTVGVIGLGHVGRDFVRLLAPFECDVLGYDVVESSKAVEENSVMRVDLDTLLKRSDVVSVHVALNESTRNLLDATRLGEMKPGAILVNTSRGQIVDEDALKRVLQAGRLAGAAFDVFATEPPVDRELIALPNFLATPHVGGSTEEAILAMGRAAIEGLEQARSVRGG